MAAIRLFEEEDLQADARAQAVQQPVEAVQQPVEAVQQPVEPELFANNFVDNSKVDQTVVSEAEILSAQTEGAILDLLARGVPIDRVARQVNSLPDGTVIVDAISHLTTGDDRIQELQNAIKEQKNEEVVDDQTLALQAQQLRIDEEALKKQEAEELAVAAAAEEAEQEELEAQEEAEQAEEQNDFYEELYGDDDDFSMGPGRSFFASDEYNFSDYLDEELFDEDFYYEEFIDEPEQSMEADGLSASASLDSDDLGADGEMDGDGDLEAGKEGYDIGDPELEMSALTSVDGVNPELEGEGKDAEGKDADGLDIDGQEASIDDIDVGEPSVEDQQKSAPELDAGEMNVMPLQSSVIDEPEVEKPSITPVGTPVNTDQQVNEATALLAMTGAATDTAAVVEQSKTALNSMQSQDVSGTATLDVQSVVDTTKAAVLDTPPPADAPESDAPQATTKAPAIDKTELIDAAKSIGIGFNPDLIRQLSQLNMKDFTLDFKDLGPTGTVPPEVGTSLVANVSFSKGPAAQTVNVGSAA